MRELKESAVGYYQRSGVVKDIPLSQAIPSADLFSKLKPYSPVERPPKFDDYHAYISSNSRWFLDWVSAEIAKKVQIECATAVFKPPKYDDSELFFWCYKTGGDNTIQWMVAADKTSYELKAIYYGFMKPSVDVIYRISATLFRSHKITPAHERLPLKKIGFVGGIDCELGSGSIDSSRLASVISYCLSSGIAIDPSFEVDNVNLCDGRDFLSEDKIYDLLILGYIFIYAGEIPTSTEREDYTGGSTINSEHHNDHNWKRRIEKTNAKLAISFGGIQSELTVNVLNDSEQFSVLIPAENTHQKEYKEKERDYPFSAAFALDKSYVKKLRLFYKEAALDNTTTLSKVISEQEELSYSTKSL